ncbi:cell wall protein [Streptomyces poriferorum]|uniref:cell wall protein n=1 Tax=Streptomyces poriferorum TaxID=2798799 RepID=UPI00273DC1F8|nr:cell wall protein [Streptomyces sp. Alt1]WLQ48440.1 cell wall protein [Streptomyces sp. Alt1]
MEWLVEAGLHRRAGATTLAVARDLAGRMDYRLGFVLYDLEGTAARCGVSAATVKRHVRVLRELGALVWRRHGSKRNLRLAGRPYAGTATIYAATVPPVYDEAMGYRLEGVGYGARVCGVTDSGRALAVEAGRTAVCPVDNSVVDKPGSGGRAPHSSGSRHDVPKADPSGRLNYTSRERATSTAASTPQGLKDSSGGSGQVGGRSRGGRSAGPSTGGNCSPQRHPLQVARDIAVARQVRPLVGWTQGEGLRRLAFALRPLINRGLDAHDIAAELHSWWLDWRPARPAAYIKAELERRGERETAVAHAGVRPPEAFCRAVTDLRIAVDGHSGREAPAVADGPVCVIDGLSSAEVVELRSAAAVDHGLVLAALENLGERVTRRLYTNRLVDTVLLREFGGVHMVVGC